MKNWQFSLVVWSLASHSLADDLTGKKSMNPQNAKYQIELQDVSAQPTLVIKGKAKVEEVGPVIGGILERVEKFIVSKKSRATGAPFTRTLNFKDGILEFESGFPVEAKMAGSGEIVSAELPKGKVVTTIHVGSQETSQQAYEAIHNWLSKNKKSEAGAPWEVYLSDASVTPTESSKMQVYFPVR